MDRRQSSLSFGDGRLGAHFCHYGYHPIFFPVNRRKLSLFFENQPKAFMPEDDPVKLYIPQMRHAPDYTWLKILVVIVLFALLAAGSMKVMMDWWGATI
jgi:hypothetical protein